MAKTVDVLVLGGGSSAKTWTSGVAEARGGAAGIFVTQTVNITKGIHPVVVGTGGTVNGNIGNDGGQSSILSVVATGGIITTSGNLGGSNANYNGSSYAGAGSASSASVNNGGNATQSSFDGTSRYYGAGGRGTNTVVGSPGTGFGYKGDGGDVTSSTVVSAGKDGIVIVKYLTSSKIVATGGTITTSGLYTIHTFTSSGDFEVTSLGISTGFFNFF